MAKRQEVHRREPSGSTASSCTPPAEALDLVKSLAPAKFDETVELAVRLGVDPRKADQMVRGTVALPVGHRQGRAGRGVRHRRRGRRGPRAPAPTSSAPTTSPPQVEGGMLDFDVAIATPDLMPLVGRLGRVLGPRGLMPNPKTGTVTTDVGKAVTEFKGGKVEYRTDRYGNVHVPIGKVSFDADALLANFRAVLDELQRAKPASAKGRYIKRITVVLDDGPRRQGRPQPPPTAEDDGVSTAATADPSTLPADRAHGLSRHLTRTTLRSRRLSPQPIARRRPPVRSGAERPPARLTRRTPPATTRRAPAVTR